MWCLSQFRFLLKMSPRNLSSCKSSAGGIWTNCLFGVDFLEMEGNVSKCTDQVLWPLGGARASLELSNQTDYRPWNALISNPESRKETGVRFYESCQKTGSFSPRLVSHFLCLNWETHFYKNNEILIVGVSVGTTTGLGMLAQTRDIRQE